jgi:hypothetical protein
VARNFTRRLVTAAGSAAMVVTLAAADIKVKTEYDREADFASLRTYTWLPTPSYTTTMAPHAPDERFERERLDEPIRAAVDRVLIAKHLPASEPGSSPDFYIVYYAAMGVGMNTSVLGEHYAYLTGWGSPLPGTTATQSFRVIEEGTIVVDILRGDRTVAIWRGQATGAVDRTRTVEQRLRTIEEAARKLFAKFPPKR